MKQTENDGITQFWKDNVLVGYIDENENLFGVNPITGFAQRITSNTCPTQKEELERWLKPLQV